MTPIGASGWLTLVAQPTESAFATMHSTLRAIAERRPSTLAELVAIQGMGEAKVERFGEAFLEVLREG